MEKMHSEPIVTVEEILKLIENYELTAYELSKHTGLSSVGIQKIIDKKTKKPSLRTLEEIKSYITKVYLDNIKEGKKDSVESSFKQKKEAPFVELPINEQLKILYEQNLDIIEKQKEIFDQSGIIEERINDTLFVLNAHMSSIFNYWKLAIEESKAKKVDKIMDKIHD